MKESGYKHDQKNAFCFTHRLDTTVVLHYPAAPRLEEGKTVYETVTGTLRDISDYGAWITVRGRVQFHPWTYIVKLEFPHGTI